MKTMKIKNKDFAFVISVLLFLLLPALLFNWKGKESKSEKRNLATLPSLITDGKLNVNFFSGFDKYLGDRCGLRYALTYLYRLVYDKGAMISANQKVIFGKDGYLFLSYGSDNVADFLKENLYTDEELERAAETVKDRKDWCEKRGIRFIAVIGPNKHSVYGDYYPVSRPEGITRADQIVSALKDLGVDVIFPRDLLIESRKKYSVPLYYKTDTHWNGIGAMIAAKLIIEKIHSLFPEKQFPHIEYDITYKKTSGNGDLTGMLGVASYGRDYDTAVKPIGGNWEEYYRGKKREGTGGVETINRNKALPKALVYRDSFCSSLEPFLSAQFSEAEYRWKMFTEEEKDYVKTYRPDIVIWEWVERLDLPTS